MHIVADLMAKFHMSALIQAFLDFRGFDFRNFWFNAVYNSECPRCRQNLLVYDCCQIFVQILIPQTYKKICFVFRIAIAPMWIILARKGITTMGWLAGLDCSNWLALITSRLLSIVEIDHIFSILLYFNLINMTLFFSIILFYI